MVFGLFFIVGVYALGAAAVHAAYNQHIRGRAGNRHYVLYTLNDGHFIEWAVRSLIWFYWLQGHRPQITIIDEGSTDDTLSIAGSLAKTHSLQVHQANGWDEADAVISSLVSTSDRQNTSRLPSTHTTTFHSTSQHDITDESYIHSSEGLASTTSTTTPHRSGGLVMPSSSSRVEWVEIRLRRSEDRRKLPFMMKIK